MRHAITHHAANAAGSLLQRGSGHLTRHDIQRSNSLKFAKGCIGPDKNVSLHHLRTVHVAPLNPWPGMNKLELLLVFTI